jgi:hypothetical protein
MELVEEAAQTAVENLASLRAMLSLEKEKKQQQRRRARQTIGVALRDAMHRFRATAPAAGLPTPPSEPAHVFLSSQRDLSSSAAAAASTTATAAASAGSCDTVLSFPGRDRVPTAIHHGRIAPPDTVVCAVTGVAGAKYRDPKSNRLPYATKEALIRLRSTTRAAHTAHPWLHDDPFLRKYKQ